ncbi:hypothetical protein [Leeuwenhoekiella sp. CH_XMU1409-2]|uniref:hypothetical protein n=1 Tax=Leeuwenhoekiella sp. CH_XMU1409-2 TaxID=3107768 RepID=UPI00300B1D5C
MENNLKNKAKFFSQYWDQKVLTGIPVDKPSTFRRLNHQNIQKGIMYSFLELRSLSNINNEDIKELAIILCVDWEESKEFTRLLSAGYKRIYDLLGDPISYGEFVFAIDYLRSKGYALLYNGLSVEDQIEYRWIKIK